MIKFTKILNEIKARPVIVKQSIRPGIAFEIKDKDGNIRKGVITKVYKNFSSWVKWDDNYFKGSKLYTGDQIVKILKQNIK